MYRYSYKKHCGVFICVWDLIWPYTNTVFPRIEAGPRIQAGGADVIVLIEAGLLSTSQALNISRSRGLHTDRVWQVCTVCVSQHDMKLGISVFWLPYSDPDPQSKPITNLLTNVLIVSVKYIILPSVRRNVNILIEAGGFYSRKYGRCHYRLTFTTYSCKFRHTRYHALVLAKWAHYTCLLKNK